MTRDEIRAVLEQELQRLSEYSKKGGPDALECAHAIHEIASLLLSM